MFATHLRARRTEHGLSLRALAERVHCSKSLLAAIETGHRTPSSQLARLLDSALGTENEFQTLAPLRLAPVVSPAVFKEGDDVKRQAFLRSLAAVVAGMAVGDPIAEAIGRGMNSNAAPLRVGSADIEHVNHSIRMFDEWQDLYGGGICHDAIAGQVDWATQLLGAAASDAVRTELHSAVGFLVNIAGWGAFDAGLHDRARHYFQLALQCAEEAGDWGLRANILSDMARQAVYIGRPDDGLSYIELAQVRQDRQTAATRAMLSTVHARALAKVGRADEAYSAVGQAEDHFSHHDSAAESPAWITYFGAAELAGDSGHALTDIALSGHYIDAARQRLQTSLDSYKPAQARARAFALGKMALLELRVGDAGTGIMYANASLEAEKALKSRRAQDDLMSVYRALNQHGSVPGASSLRDRIGASLQIIS